MTLPAGSALFDDELLDHPDADPAAVAVFTPQYQRRESLVRRMVGGAPGAVAA